MPIRHEGMQHAMCNDINIGVKQAIFRLQSQEQDGGIPYPYSLRKFTPHFYLGKFTCTLSQRPLKKSV